MAVTLILVADIVAEVLMAWVFMIEALGLVLTTKR